MNQTTKKRRFGFGIGWKLFLIALGFVFLAGAMFVSETIGRLQILSSSNAIVAEDVPVVRSVQEALQAMIAARIALETALDIRDPAQKSEIDVLTQVFDDSVARFSMFLSALTWGSESEAFRRSASGVNYERWVAEGFLGKIVVLDSHGALEQLTGTAGLYFGGAVKNARDALVAHKEYLERTEEGKSSAALQAEAKVYESIAQSRKLAALTSENMKLLTEFSSSEIEQSARALEAAERESRSRALNLSIIGLLVLFGASAVLVRFYIQKPLSQLMTAVNAFGEGNLGVRANVNSNDELGSLGVAVNAMADRLVEYTAGLEGAVQLRTKELDKKLIDIEDSKRAILNLLEDVEAEKAKTERVVVERTKELQDEKARLLASINSLSIGFILADVNHKILLKNSSLNKILDITGDFASINEIATSFPVSGKTDIQFNLAKTCVECVNFKRTLEAKDVPYGLKFLRMLCTPVVSEGVAGRGSEQDVIGYVILVEDTTEAKIMERSRDEFFAVASHELRTPLTAIRGNADMILDMYADKIVDKDMKEMLSDIEISSVRLIDVVNDFLEVSRLEQGRIEVKKETFDIHEVIDKALRDLKPIVEKKGITLTYEPPVSPLPKVVADRARVEQILINLVGNAAKFTKEGGITITAQKEESFVRVKVTDTGIGISPQNQSLLFRKFQQAGEQMLARDITQGTGLGLYISRHLVSYMGGTIGVEKSDLGKGSTFAFTLPIIAG